jgi:hypothetical protein
LTADLFFKLRRELRPIPAAIEAVIAPPVLVPKLTLNCAHGPRRSGAIARTW